VVFLATISGADAAVLCVGPSATGSGSGADWNNVKAWSATPARGDTWCLRDGTYAARTFNVATSGTTLITIKKATASDHFSDTGWQTSYANQAVFGTITEFDSSYWVFDGQTGGGPGGWTNGFGFKIDASNLSTHQPGLNIINGAGNVTVRHVEIVGDGGDGDQTFPNNDGIGLNGGTGIVISYAYIHDMGRCPFICLAADGLIVEYVYTGWYEYTPNEHSEIASLNGNNQTFRYCVFGYVNGTGGIMYNGNGGAVYGCVFYPAGTWNAGANGCIGAKSSNEPCQNINIYNNTIINGVTPFIGMYMPNYSGNVAYNNLFYNSDSGMMNGITHDYNHYVGVSTDGGPHDSTGSGALFMSLGISSPAFATLVSNTPAGTMLPAPYNFDPLGNNRGTWTRGAYQYGSLSGPLILVSPNSQSFGSVAVGTATNASLTVHNNGGGTLAGTVSVAAPFSTVSGGSYSLGSNQSQTVTVAFSPTAGGGFSQVATFTGGGGASVTVTGSGSYPGSNMPPVAIASGNPANGVAPLSVTFSSAGSYDPEGAVLTYSWTFGDGLTSTTANPAHAYQAAGVYTAQLSVSDGTNTTAATPITITASNPGSGLVAAYGFEEGTGSTVADFSGNGNTGTISGATWTATGRFGNALAFNGASAMVTVSDSPSLDLTGGMTLEAWVYPAAVNGWRDVIYRAKDIYYVAGSSPQGQAPATSGTFSSGPVYGTTALPLNTWTHLASTYDRATLRLYVNGVQVASQAQTQPISTSALPLSIGGDTVYGQYFAGQIDEVRVYNRALSAGEIQTDMNTSVSGALKPLPPTNLHIVGP